MADRDVLLRVGTGVLPATTSTTQTTLSISGYGATPDGLLWIGTNATADDTQTEGGFWINHVDAVYNQTCGIWSADNQAAISDEWSNIRKSTAAVYGQDGATSSWVARTQTDTTGPSLADPVADGWNYDLYSGSGSSRLTSFLLSGGADVTSKVTVAPVANAVDGGTANLATTVTDPENVLGIMTYQHTTANGYLQDAILSIGVISYRKTDSRIQQACIGYYADDSVATSDVRGICYSGRCAVGLEGGVIDHSLEITSVSGSNMVCTTRGTPTTPANINVTWISFPDDVQVWAGVVDSPISTAADWEVTSVGFRPGFAIVGSSLVESTNSLIAGEGHIGFGMIDDTNVARCISISNKDAESTTNAAVITDSALVHQYEAGASSFTERYHLDAPSTSPFTATGIKFPNADILAADGTARKWLLACVQKPNTYNYVFGM